MLHIARAVFFAGLLFLALLYAWEKAGIVFFFLRIVSVHIGFWGFMFIFILFLCQLCLIILQSAYRIIIKFAPTLSCLVTAVVQNGRFRTYMAEHSCSRGFLASQRRPASVLYRGPVCNASNTNSCCSAWAITGRHPDSCTTHTVSRRNRERCRKDKHFPAVISTKNSDRDPELFGPEFGRQS